MQPASDPPDDLQLIALMERIARHDQAALRSLYDATSRRLYGVALRVLGNREWAEDALQDAFLTIWRVAGDYKAPLAPPMAWLGLIVRSRSLDFRRRRAAERVDQHAELDDYVQDTVEGDSPDPQATAAASEQAWALHECLRKLEAKHREVVSLAYLRDLSHGELAEQLKLPLGTVKTWIRRGVAQLRGCMNRYA